MTAVIPIQTKPVRRPPVRLANAVPVGPSLSTLMLALPWRAHPPWPALTWFGTRFEQRVPREQRIAPGPDICATGCHGTGCNLRCTRAAWHLMYGCARGGRDGLIGPPVAAWWHLRMGAVTQCPHRRRAPAVKVVGKVTMLIACRAPAKLRRGCPRGARRAHGRTPCCDPLRVGGQRRRAA